MKSEDDAAAEKAARETKANRSHGFQLPLHPLQVVAWVVIVFLGVIYFGVTVPGLPYSWQPAAYIILGICLTIHVVCLLAATYVDPADDSVLKKVKPHSAAAFDRTVHKHVIENFYCNICLAEVGPKTKHCGACNKCVSDFDHHCRWLNNCVGGKNYKWFAASLVTAFVCCLVITSLCALQFAAYFTDSQSGIILQQYSSHLRGNTTLSSASSTPAPDFQILYASVPHEAWLAVTAVEAVMSFVALLLLAHLIIFHVYLRCKGMSTYDYVVMDRRQDNAATREAREAKQATGKCWQRQAVAPATKADMGASGNAS